MLRAAVHVLRLAIAAVLWLPKELRAFKDGRRDDRVASSAELSSSRFESSD